MVDPRAVYLVGLHTGKLAGLHAYADLLVRLSQDAKTKDPKLTDAIDVANGAAEAERDMATRPIVEALTAARASGVDLPDVPRSVAGWSAWRDAYGQMAGAIGELGLAAHAFTEVWTTAESLAYLRRADRQHSTLLGIANGIAPAVTMAWQTYRAALVATPNALLEMRVRELDDWVRRAPAADAVESPSHILSGAHGHIVHWRKTLNLLMVAVGSDLVASPAKHTQYATWIKPLTDLGARDFKRFDGPARAHDRYRAAPRQCEANLRDRAHRLSARAWRRGCSHREAGGVARAREAHRSRPRAPEHR